MTDDAELLEEVLALFREEGRSLQVTYIASRLSITRREANRAVTRLVEQGKLREPMFSFYELIK
jgi:DNA-binding IclR family transcriptional regulator